MSYRVNDSLVAEFLYRALRPEEIERGRLIPKLQTPFLAEPRLPNELPFFLGQRREHAVRDHQDKIETSGASTTPHIYRAEQYAHNNRRIARIRVDYLSRFGVEAIAVVDEVKRSMICVPEDDEVILICPGAAEFPHEIIDKIVEFVPGRETSF